MASFRFPLTLRRLFLLSLLGLVAGLAALFWLILAVSQKTLLQSARQLQEEVGQAAAAGIASYLDRAPAAVGLFEREAAQGLIRIGDDASVRDGLLSLLLADENLSEASFTYGADRGFDAGGDRVLAPGSAGEITVFRPTPDPGAVVCRRIRFDGGRGGFVAVSSAATLGSRGWTPIAAGVPAVDPAASLTFRTPADRDDAGRLLSTDLHWSQLDDALPEAERRVELSVMKALPGSGAKFAGVLRVGLLGARIERAVLQAVPTEGRDHPPRVFLCDAAGRLIAASFPGEKRIAEFDGDLRLRVTPLPDEVGAALAAPALRGLGAGERPEALVPVEVAAGGRAYLCTFRALPGTQDWIVGVLAARDDYLGPMLALRARMLGASLALIAAIVAVGFLVLRGVGRAHGLIAEETARMNAFDFAPARHRSFLADVGEVLSGLERAKTAMRAMGKYVPVDLVRRLYRDGREPVLGGEAADLSLLFTDIRDFTVYAEATEPGLLARVLGRYLDVMAGAIQGERGTVDKYIGDAVMAFWNAPEPAADHPLRACRAALRCRAALAALYDSPEWAGRPRFETRFGLHRCAASVGHFGAADRFNYTAIGDGVNLAARLEGLNKYYGTAILASGAVEAAARDAFLFRRLDRVAVKGKSREVAVYELVGERGEGAALPPAALRYEAAFAAYQEGDFAEALRLLEGNGEDGPSRFLGERCRRFLERPPAPGWNGIHAFEAK